MKNYRSRFLFVITLLIMSSCDQVVTFPSQSTSSINPSSPSIPFSSQPSLSSTSPINSSNVSTLTSDISSISLIESSELSSSYSNSPTSFDSSFESTSIPISSEISSSSNSYTYDGYYASIADVNDQQLKAKLTTLLRSILDANQLLPSHITYGNSRYDIPKYDRDPNNPNHVILVYSRNSVSGTWDNGTTWNREHLFPQSLMGVETSNSNRHKGADYHNLKPENPGVNSSRGNKYFAEATTTTSYAPPSEVRGDLARIMFYMVTMWPELSLVDIATGDPSIYTMAQLSLFLKWHHEDPVDAFESNRNEVIYSLQGNRNPYVDHQELVCRIWGPTNSTTQSYCAA